MLIKIKRNNIKIDYKIFDQINDHPDLLFTSLCHLDFGCFARVQHLTDKGPLMCVRLILIICRKKNWETAISLATKYIVEA